MNERTALYRHFAADDRLLYVGISFSAVSRLSQHNTQAHWSGHIARMTVEWFDTRAAALDAETNAIFNEKPLHNRKRPTPKGFKRIQRYEYERPAGCCNYELRDFPWFAGWQSPVEVDDALVALVRDPAHAIQASMTGLRDETVATLLVIAPEEFAEIKHGRKPVPEWFVEPFCTLTGCALLRQVCPPLPRPPMDGYYDEWAWLTYDQKVERMAAELRSAAA